MKLTLAIRENKKEEKSFKFSYIDENKGSKLIDILQIKKATDVDKLSSADLINLTIRTSTFPENLKRTQLVPLHKKNDPMEQSFFRPVSVLYNNLKSV